MTSNAVDFGKAILRFHSDRLQNTARLQQDALCSLSGVSEERSESFALTTPHIGEDMHPERDLIQAPAYKFRMIASARDHRRIVDNSVAWAEVAWRQSIPVIRNSQPIATIGASGNPRRIVSAAASSPSTWPELLPAQLDSR